MVVNVSNFPATEFKKLTQIMQRDGTTLLEPLSVDIHKVQSNLNFALEMSVNNLSFHSVVLFLDVCNDIPQQVIP